MNEVVIVATARSAVGKRNGTLGLVHPTEVLGKVLQASVARAGIAAGDVGMLVGGCINKLGAQGMNITRTAWLATGGAMEVPAITIDSQCGSSQEAVSLAANLIASGNIDCAIACGVENMTRLPIGSDAIGLAPKFGKPYSRAYFDFFEATSQFEGAERVAEKYGVTRADADALGLESQLRAARAIAEGRFESQIVPLEVPVFDADGNRTKDSVLFAKDEVPRQTSLDALAQLKPVARENGIHTAGSSSQIADGAAAVVLMSRKRADALGIAPLARVVSSTLVGCDPVLMLEGPIPATQKLLKDAGLRIDDIDTFEVNEAFASVVLGWARTVGADLAKVNPNGGAIALGHPLGATGCFLVGKAVHELQRSGGRYGLVSMCCGGGLGTGTLLERC